MSRMLPILAVLNVLATLKTMSIFYEPICWNTPVISTDGQSEWTELSVIPQLLVIEGAFTVYPWPLSYHLLD
jgi:hypothetical protein